MLIIFYLLSFEVAANGFHALIFYRIDSEVSLQKT